MLNILLNIVDVDTVSTVPLTCLLEMVLAACKYSSLGPVKFENIILKNGPSISESSRTLQTTVMVGNDSSNAEIAIRSFIQSGHAKDKHWILHAESSVRLRTVEASPSVINLDAYQSDATIVEKVDYYLQQSRQGAEFSNRDQVVNHAWITRKTVLLQINLSEIKI